MKKTARLLALILILMFCMQALPAYADNPFLSRFQEAEEEAGDDVLTLTEGDYDDGEPQYPNTIEFIDLLEEYDIDYSYSGIDSDGDEGVYIYEDDYTVILYFSEDQELISIRVWYVIEYAEDDLMDVIYACNDLNYSYRFVTLYADESDNTVTASMDVIVREGNSVADIAAEAVAHLENILAEAYEVLGEFDIS